VVARVRSIVKKELRQVIRDRRTLGVLLAVPLFLLVIFGYAISLDVRHVSLGIYDGDRSEESRRYIASFQHSEYFDVKFHAVRSADLDEYIARESLQAALIIPEDFSERLLRNEPVRVQILVDGSNGSIAATIVSYIEAFTSDYSSRISVRLVRSSDAARIQLLWQPRVWYNPELRSANFLVPGLIVFILIITTVISTALSVVREKERGTMEQIVVSPIRSAELVIGKTMPHVLISIAITTGIIVTSSLLFGLTIKGSYVLLIFVTLLFLLGGLGLGLLISTLADTQLVAFMLSVLITLLPSFVLSGFVFPIRNMPKIIQAFTYLLPARYYMVVLRSIILKGAGLSAFWREVVFLSVFAFLSLGVSAVRLRRGMKAV
jgi:ABC-2 type transport system permease protein